MKEALRALQQVNFGIGLLQETKLTRGVHTHYRAGYGVWATESECRHRGGIDIFCREEEGS